jgi:hypothetical protein
MKIPVERQRGLDEKAGLSYYKYSLGRPITTGSTRGEHDEEDA